MGMVSLPFKDGMTEICRHCGHPVYFKDGKWHHTGVIWGQCIKPAPSMKRRRTCPCRSCKQQTLHGKFAKKIDELEEKVAALENEKRIHNWGKKAALKRGEGGE